MDPVALEQLVQRLQEVQALGKLVGRAPSFIRAIRQLPVIARAAAPVVIFGETGTGKELVARAIHYAGPRAAKPFVATNCGALVDTLLEDELFGHESGAFTDARARRRGLVVQAHGGTLFLDEIDALTARAQVALLRVIQDGVVRPLGSERDEAVDVRFVVATNTDLVTLVSAGRFREDLYYRLRVFSVELPSLGQRPEDVLLLARHFLEQHAAAVERPRCFSADAEALLARYHWPGNVRELENTVIRAMHVCEGETIEAEDLGLLVPAGARPQHPVGRFRELKQRAIDAFELEYLTTLMVAHRGNVSRAAQAAGKERRELGKLLKKHRLEPKRFLRPSLRPRDLSA